MRKTLLVALIAATALVPPAAIAQERGGRGEGRSPRAERASPAPRAAYTPRSEARPQREARPQQTRGGMLGATRSNWQPAVREAQAQARQDGQTRPDRGPGAQQRPDRRPDAQRPDRRPDFQRPDRRPDAQRPDRRPGDRNWNDNRRPGDRNWNDNRRPGDRNWNDNRRPGDRNWNRDRGSYNRWNNSWRNDNRYNWQRYRASNRHIYRLPRYYAPAGYSYGYRRFGIGFTLSSILFSQQYWINDPIYYRLPDVWGPYRWVRYYNDALLVDIYTGEVVDTVYDIFW